MFVHRGVLSLIGSPRETRGLTGRSVENIFLAISLSEFTARLARVLRRQHSPSCHKQQKVLLRISSWLAPYFSMARLARALEKD